MRNVFDQYNQVENKVTHALFCALNEDRGLLRSFLCDFSRIALPTDISGLNITVQKLPGQHEISEDEFERAGIPDAWITNDEGWCLLIEIKVDSSVSVAQLRGHFATAARRGFENPSLLLLTIKPPREEMPHNSNVVEWKSLYRWIDNQSRSSHWARRVREFLETIELREVERGRLQEGALTAFNGFDFGQSGYSYLQAKRLLKLAIGELRSNPSLMGAIGADPTLPGRGAITGSSGIAVWDCIRPITSQPEADFTRFAHYTLGVESDQVSAMMTIPDKLRADARKKLRRLGRDGFIDILLRISGSMETLLKSYPGSLPRIRAVQRRYPSQRSAPFIDAELIFDLRTAFEGNGPKYQPQWTDALFSCFNNKNSNFQFQIGVFFPYDKCAAISTAGAIECIGESWIACRPLLDALTET